MIALVLAATGCEKTPTEAYFEMVAAAKMGDRETFLAAFTDDSRHVIEALLELSDIYGLDRNDPYRLLVHTEVVGEEELPPEKVPGVEEPRDARNIIVQVQHRRRKIKMVNIDGAWKIDAFELEKSWEKRANFSF